MESLNSYVSDGESDSSPCTEARQKSNSGQEEADANCEPITMDMSEDSCSSSEDKNDTVEPVKKQHSKSLSPSPATSYSSADSSPDPKKRKDEDSKAASLKDKVKESSKRRRSDEDDRRKKDRDYKRDDDKDRKFSSRDKSKDRYRDKDSDRYRNSKRYEKKRSHRSRSRSRSRSYSKHSGSSSSSSKRKIKSRSRSKSRSRDRRSRSRDRRSRSRDRRSRSRDRRSRSRDRRSRSRDRHHYRHESRRSSKRRSPYKSRRSRSRSHSKEKSRSYDWKSSSKLKVLEKLGIEIKVPPGGVEVTQASIAAAQATSQLTPQLLLQKTMEEQVQKVRTATGIELPSYYNPIAVNPTKYAEQIQKRRLLWGNKDKQPIVKPTEEPTVATVAPKPAEVKGSGTIWQGATFGGDQDGRMTAKFKRLMGIKNVEKDGSGDASKSASGGSDLIKKQEEMFHSMESQYEVARLATHSHRGLGLGFGTFQPR